ncbi:MAG: hypothetical protein ABSF59_10955 [Candidatus Sulfotelmatobacter sp.]|jgi:hypothetical protein
MRRLGVICVLLTSLSTLAAAEDIKLEDVVARHLAAIGTPEARAAVKSRGIQGTLQFRDLTGRIGNATGNWGEVSEKQDWNFVMKFGSGEWRGERFVFNGDKVDFAVFTSSRRPSPFGDFVHSQEYLIKEGLLGGELSTGWALENPDRNHGKLEYLGLKKEEGRDLLCVEYFAKGNSDMKIKLFFDPETFQHVMTQYSLIWTPGSGHNAPRTGGSRSDEGQSRYLIEERFSDFHADNGITLPRHYDLRYTQEPQRGGSRSYDWDMVADKVFTNIAVDPANFEIK